MAESADKGSDFISAIRGTGQVALHALERPILEIKQRALAEAAKAEQQLRESLGGNDDSLSEVHVKALLRKKYEEIFAAMDPAGEGLVPIEELEDLCGAAGLFEARNEVGVLAYDADLDGNGALNFEEFEEVLSKIHEYHSAAAAAPRAVTARSASFFFGTEGASLTLKEVCFRTLDDPHFSDLSRAIGAVDIIATVCAILVFILQTEPSFDARSLAFTVLEGVAAVIFVALLIGRLVSSPSKRSFLLSPWNWIDLLTVVPFFIDEAYSAVQSEGGGSSALRVLRVFRMFRVLRLSRYLPYIELMASALSTAWLPLINLIFALTLMYIERGEWDPTLGAFLDATGVPTLFTDAWASTYFTIVTLTTVGYGEMFPISGWGKAFGALIVFAGEAPTMVA